MLDRRQELPDRIQVIQAWLQRCQPGEILQRTAPGVYLRRDGTAGPPEWALRLHWGSAFRSVPMGQLELRGLHETAAKAS